MGIEKMDGQTDRQPTVKVCGSVGVKERERPTVQHIIIVTDHHNSYPQSNKNPPDKENLEHLLILKPV